MDYDDMPQVTVLKPDNQLELTPEELEKEVPPRVLYPVNPRAPYNIARFSYKDRNYKVDDQLDQTVFHYQDDGYVVMRDSPEHQELMEMLQKKRKDAEAREAAVAVDVEVEEVEGEESVRNTLRNQFSFSERASQTPEIVLRMRGVTTEPPPTNSWNEVVTQWTVFDAYMADQEEARKRDEVKQKLTPAELMDEPKKKEQDPLYSDSMRTSIKVMERMVNQNAEQEIYHDFKYWEDKSDEFRDGEGSLLPLWRFAAEKAKRKQVTALQWNPKYDDLFAVGFGSYDFLKQGPGLICCYSLKNSRFPEFTYPTDSGVCCLDWHSSEPAMLAVGLYDGTVLVHDVRHRSKRPLYASTVQTNKHTDPVWEVRWTTTADERLNFWSISSDGRVSNWRLMKNRIESEENFELKLQGAGEVGEEDEATITGFAGGLCFDFHKTMEFLFLVGTEEGRIHKCSKAYSSQYLETYDGHSMAVYSVRWNPVHPNIFVSASADWTVKVWDHAKKAPVLTFDLGQAVGDAAWAPYSSTVFAAITTDGIVHVYDLNVNRNDRICSQKVVKRAKLTHLAFNMRNPILNVGDDRGGVNCLKLSPNLRGKFTTPIGEDPPDLSTEEAWKAFWMERMEHLLDMVTEKPVGPPVPPSK
jgi:dynein intermediate chain 1